MTIEQIEEVIELLDDFTRSKCYKCKRVYVDGECKRCIHSDDSETVAKVLYKYYKEENNSWQYLSLML